MAYLDTQKKNIENFMLMFRTIQMTSSGTICNLGFSIVNPTKGIIDKKKTN